MKLIKCKHCWSYFLLVFYFYVIILADFVSEGGNTMNANDLFVFASRKCSGDVLIWQQFWNIYPFTTENISGYIDNFDLAGKSLLTVGSSGDQVLNAILLGSKDITLVDINPFAKYYFYLKMAAIMELEMDEYLLFLRYKNYPEAFKNNLMVFNEFIFKKLSGCLKEIDRETYDFWYDLFRFYSRKDIRDQLFSIDERSDKFIRACNLYLHDDELFKQLKANIKDVKSTFETGDILTAEHNRNYDNIWLSNIATYGFSDENILAVFNKYREYLNDGGKLLLSYLYDTTIDSKYDESWDAIYNISKVMEMLGNDGLEIKSFVGTYGIIHDINKIKDSVLIYKKVKTK